MTRIIMGSNIATLRFEDSDTDLFKQYEQDKLDTQNKYLKLLELRNGIYAPNQGKYVSSRAEFNRWDY